jgi:hypothetical protein
MGCCLRVLCGLSRASTRHDVAVPFSFRTSASNQQAGEGLSKNGDKGRKTDDGEQDTGDKGHREAVVKIFLTK